MLVYVVKREVSFCPVTQDTATDRRMSLQNKLNLNSVRRLRVTVPCKLCLTIKVMRCPGRIMVAIKFFVELPFASKMAATSNRFARYFLFL